MEEGLGWLLASLESHRQNSGAVPDRADGTWDPLKPLRCPLSLPLGAHTPSPKAGFPVALRGCFCVQT